MTIEILFTAMIGIMIFIGTTLVILHILAILGIGEGTPFTAQHMVTQRYYKGDASVFAGIIALIIMATVFLF